MKTAAALAVLLAARATAFAEATPRLQSAEMLRLADSPVLRLRFDRPPDPAAIRVHLAAAAADAVRLPEEATHLIDGLRFFARSPDPAPGGWDEAGTVAAVADGNTLTLLIPRAATAPRLRWAVEVSDADWRASVRHPRNGWNDTLLRNAPEVSPIVDTALSPETYPLRSQPPLTARFFEKHRARPWARAAVGAADLPFRVQISESGEQDGPPGEPALIERDGPTLRLSGERRGVLWTLVATPGEKEWALEGELVGGERALTVAVEWMLPPGQWFWRGDFESTRPLASNAGPLRNAMSFPFGAGLQSRLPIGVVSRSDGRALALAVQPDEPRIFRIEAADAPPRLRAVFDIGLTPHTREFPGRAAFALHYREWEAGKSDPFRSAWADFQNRHPALFERKLARAIYWMPDPAPAANVAELGPLQGPGASAQQRWLALRPFHARWPTAPAPVPDVGEALRRLRFFAAFDRGWTGLDARAALLAGARRADGSLALTVAGDTASVELNAHPEFFTPPSQPLNRAMAMWAAAASSRAAGESVGVLIEGLGELTELDFNRAALAATRNPAAWKRDAPGVAAANSLTALEFLTPLSAAMREDGGLLALDASGPTHPFAAWPADLLLVRLPAPNSEEARAVWSAWRALAGAKPVVALYDAGFEQWLPEDQRTFWAACLFHGFLPTPRGAPDGVSYWSRAAWFERDRPLFRTYWPWIRRLAEAGWRVEGPARADAPGWRIEHFGNEPILFLTLRREPDGPPMNTIRVPLRAGGVVLDPLSGSCAALAPEQDVAAIAVRLAPGESGLRVVTPWTDIGELASFLKGWVSGEGESVAAAMNLRACAAEFDAGVQSDIRSAGRRFRVRLTNRGTTPAVVSDLRWLRGATVEALTAEHRTLAPDEVAEWTGDAAAVPGGERAWVELRWRVQRGARSCDIARLFRLSDLDPAP